MTNEEATLAVVDALTALRVPYMLVGSLATNFYGIPRSTQDVDFVVQPPPGALAQIAERLGPAFHRDPQASFEAFTATTRHAFHVVDSSFLVELFQLSDDPHDQQRFARRRLVRLFGREVFLPTAEDMIITKLRWAASGHRQKDLDDARNVILVQGNRIDWEYVHAWTERHGTRQLLDSLREISSGD